MSVEGAIKSIITADATLNALVGGRVRPLTGVQGETRPFLAYEITATDDPSPSHSGASGFERASVDVVVVTDTYASAVEISANAKRVLDGHSGTNNSVTVHWLRYVDQTDIEQAPAGGEGKAPYVRSQSYTALTSA